ncbi:redoxin domain-containing protein [Elizabethkingia argentiflava]|uniref:Redoxin domain-containing protein n=1 Tax=Elizabethkingia argenteiflava TaxID=2681556 RepID=A0A845PV81_9FLAO|nr:TlpA disulfide reductase family protein [Elizabethkingia argenteiflava]NAW51023.1 redoxin domain-containing protein [Elizabethkingia argenteiflava]
MKRLINILLFALTLGLIFVPEVKVFIQRSLIYMGFFKPNLAKHPAALSTTKAMSLKDVNGRITDLSALKGKIVFINFWATWCPPCIAELPTIESLYQHFAEDREVVFIILEVEGQQIKAEKLFQDQGFSLPLYFANGTIPQDFFRGKLPTSIILDKNTHMVYQSEGLTNYADPKLISFIKQLKQTK